MGVMDTTDVQWLDTEQQRHWRALQRGMLMLNRSLDRDLAASTGLSLNEYEVLVRLSEAPERRIRMSALADDVVHSRSRLTHTVTRMEKRGLVNRCPDDGDRRGVQCRLTDEGYEVLKAAAPHHVDSVRARLVDVLTGQQLKALGDGFTVIAAQIEAERADGEARAGARRASA